MIEIFRNDEPEGISLPPRKGDERGFPFIALDNSSFE
jgi:hypothetical protein